MNILLLQTDIKWQLPDANRKRAKEMIDASSQVDLIILPEMFNTGFCMSTENVSEKATAETLEWMQYVAKEKKAALAGSIATEENGRYYNRLHFVRPDGSYTIYNKRHLFSYAGEDKVYAAGEERVVVEYGGFRILLQICYDLRFPVFSRNTGDYDLIIYVANWPTSRISAWNALLRARAIENLCYVAAVNRTGNDPATSYSGGSVLIDYLGRTVVAAADAKEDAVSGEITMEPLVEFRRKFPALQDADSFKIGK
ncbi:amidohydrolase [Viscerimonas tarda]